MKLRKRLRTWRELRKLDKIDKRLAEMQEELDAGFNRYKKTWT